MNRASSPIRFLILLISLAFVFTACDRKPEDLEEWRNAKGGFEKLSEWAASDEEPMPVRIRAVQILIEEGQVNPLQGLFDGIEPPETRQMLVAGAMPTIEAMWAKQDQPVISSEDKEKGGRIRVGTSQTAIAKDAAFFLHPYANDADRAKFEGMLAEWMSKDQDLRTQLGNVTLGQVSSRSGEKGLLALQTWLRTTKLPAAVQRTTLGESDTPEVRGAIATVLVERAKADHPNLSKELEYAILENNHPNLAPYLEMAIKDPETALDVKDGFMDVLVRAKGEKATPFFTELVATQNGLMRWVSVQRLIEIRGKSGILVAAKSLPLDPEAYGDEDWKKESEITCNFVSTEMPKLGIDNIDDVLKRGLKSDRWPTQVLSIRCAGKVKAAALKDDIESLAKSKTQVPNWGDDATTVGVIASEVAATL